MKHNNKKDFEDELERMSFGIFAEKDLSHQRSIYFKKRNALLYRTVIMLVVIFVGLTAFSIYYNNKTYNENAEPNMKMIHNALQLSVNQYYYKNKSYPVTSEGKIDFDKLQKEGYLLIDIEGYKSNFSYNQNFQVLRTN